MRLAWFSPLPPSHSGIAAYSAEILPLLRRRHDVDAFVDRVPRPDEQDVWNAHDFVWKHRRTPYDLVVYQLGNASCHDYMWAYLFHYPGLVVLHDAQLHQARALYLTRRWQPRTDDYLEEFRANHPEAPPDVGLLVAAGLGGELYAHWPLVKLVLESARLTAVHNERLIRDLQERYPAARMDWFEMGVADPLADADPGSIADSRARIRDRHGIPPDAVLVCAFGGVTPEKRVATLLGAAAPLGSRPAVHVMLVGARADHYDVDADIDARGLRDRVHVTGFVADEELPAYLAAADLCACLRWPTNRETSASWLRCLGAGKATIVSDLTHLGDVPTLDPRDWRVLDASAEGARAPVAVSIDVLDEAHSLQLALERLTADGALRARLGRAARVWYDARHRLEPMADAYERLLARATGIEPPPTALPAHLLEDGTAKARRLLDPFGLEDHV